MFARVQVHGRKADIVGIDVIDNAIAVCRGPRRGLEISGFVKVGRWNLGGRRILVSLRRDCPTVRIQLHADGRERGFDELWVSSGSATVVLAEVQAGPPVVLSDDVDLDPSFALRTRH